MSVIKNQKFRTYEERKFLTNKYIELKEKNEKNIKYKLAELYKETFGKDIKPENAFLSAYQGYLHKGNRNCYTLSEEQYVFIEDLINKGLTIPDIYNQFEKKYQTKMKLVTFKSNIAHKGFYSKATSKTKSKNNPKRQALNSIRERGRGKKSVVMEIKVSSNYKQGKNNWKRLDEYNIEQKYGKMPEKSFCYHRDKDYRNCELNNLLVIKRSTFSSLSGNEIDITNWSQERINAYDYAFELQRYLIKLLAQTTSKSVKAIEKDLYRIKKGE